MAAILTHHLLGDELYTDHFRTIGQSRREYLAFLLGNQGPDPLYFAVLKPTHVSYRQLGTSLHNHDSELVLDALKRSLAILDEKEVSIGRAYALGFIGHYLLDASIHPLVYAQQESFCNAGIEGLDETHGLEVHALVESELDELFLYRLRETTIASFPPWERALPTDEGVLHVVSKMYSFMVMTLFGAFPPVELFSSSTKNYRMTMRALYSPRGYKRFALGRMERLIQDHSLLQAMSHRDIALTSSTFANEEHATWVHPFTRENMTYSAFDAYRWAKQEAAGAFALFDFPAFDAEKGTAITHEINFKGAPTGVFLEIEDE